MACQHFGRLLNFTIFLCKTKENRRKSHNFMVFIEALIVKWPFELQINRKNRILPINYTQLASQNRRNHFHSYFCHGGGVFEKSISIWHVSCHDDDSTRHDTRPQVAAKCKNGEKCFWCARMDHYLSFKKNFAEKSLLVGENDRIYYRSSISRSKIPDF